MYTLSINMWFQKLMKQFFFGIDSVVYNFISTLYNLLITIARTSPLSQADILDMADRIYKLLAVFMIFKVTFSLIMYVVNPDDFTDKSKGVGKLGTNIIISLSLLILTPYIFNYAYRLQTIILEDGSIGTLIFGQNEECGGKGQPKCESTFLDTAGDDMAFIAIQPFLIPNTSLEQTRSCANLYEMENGIRILNEGCFGVGGIKEQYAIKDRTNTLVSLTTGDSGNFPEIVLKNYAAGIEQKNFKLMFRQELAVATNSNNDFFIMEYNYIFSTIVGVVIVLILLTFCLDVALRSVKLAFLQLIAPIPIISYVDPKSGKDGMFKKWYQMCFKTYLSLFVRLLALYFALYLIDRVADFTLVDIVDGTTQTDNVVAVFIIIGALMFAKQFPEILKGLGINLDGGGFTLNPLKKLEKEALGGSLLKKPNDMLDRLIKKPFNLLGKAGKGVAMAPINGAKTLGKKTISGIDAARNGKGFKQGWNRTHGKLHNNFYKKLDEWAPDSAEARKNKASGRENLSVMDQKARNGQQVYASAHGSDKNIQFSSEYRKSYDAVNDAKGKMYQAQADKQAKVAQIENELKLGKITQTEAQERFAVINKETGTAEKRYEVAKARHEEMRKIHRKDARLEDSFDYFDKTADAEEKAKYKDKETDSKTLSDDSKSTSDDTVVDESASKNDAVEKSRVKYSVEEVTGVSAPSASEMGAPASEEESALAEFFKNNTSEEEMKRRIEVENKIKKILEQIKTLKYEKSITPDGDEYRKKSEQIKKLESELENLRKQL